MADRPFITWSDLKRSDDDCLKFDARDSYSSIGLEQLPSHFGEEINHAHICAIVLHGADFDLALKIVFDEPTDGVARI